MTVINCHARRPPAAGVQRGRAGPTSASATRAGGRVQAPHPPRGRPAPFPAAACADGACGRRAFHSCSRNAPGMRFKRRTIPLSFRFQMSHVTLPRGRLVAFPPSRPAGGRRGRPPCLADAWRCLGPAWDARPAPPPASEGAAVSVRSPPFGRERDFSGLSPVTSPGAALSISAVVPRRRRVLSNERCPFGFPFRASRVTHASRGRGLRAV